MKIVTLAIIRLPSYFALFWLSWNLFQQLGSTCGVGIQAAIQDKTSRRQPRQTSSQPSLLSS
jgi:hypothetical protein